jgi:glycerophosphoryl diester phosphodiesterase
MTLVIAHRGARSLAPENTLAAVKIAHDTGADLWETDINLTRDGRLILFHDETLLRCTNVVSQFPSRPSYRVKDFDLEEIRSLDAGSYFMETDPFSQIAEGNVGTRDLEAFAGEPVPTLEQGLVFTRENHWIVNLELKYFPPARGDLTGPGRTGTDNFLPDQTLDIIRQTGIGLDQVVISSFKHDWLERIRAKEPKIEIQALVGENDTDPLDFKDFSFPVYNANSKLIRADQIEHLKQKGKKINLFTVNDPDEFYYFVNLGVDGIFTDFPQRFIPKV